MRMRDQAVAVQRVISQKVRRVNNDTDVRSVTLANTEGKKSPTVKVSATAPALDMVPNQRSRRWNGTREHQEVVKF